MPEGVAEDKAWRTQCAVKLRTGLQQAATATALLEDSFKRVDRGVGQAAEDLHVQRHPATTAEERGN